MPLAETKALAALSVSVAEGAGGDGGKAPPPLPKRVSHEVAAQQPTAKLALMLGLPVQRVPQYGALLATLLKHTPAEHPDFVKLTEAVAAMGVANAQIKDLVRERRRIEALLDVQNRFAAKNFPAKVRARAPRSLSLVRAAV